MNQSTNLGVGTSSSPSVGVMSNVKIWGPGIAIVIGAVLTFIGFSAVGADKAGYFKGGGILLILGGIAGGLYLNGGMDKLKSSIPADKAGYIIPIVAVVVVLAVFLGVFYNYFDGEIIPLALGILVIGVIVGAVVVILKTAGASVASNAIVRFAFSWFFFMPYALFTFGFVSDIVRSRFQYIPASLAGLAGVLFNYAVSATFYSPTVPENALCEIPGLSMLSSSLAPQSMMFTLSTLSYIATNISRSHLKEGSLKSVDLVWPAWLLVLGTGIVQLGALFIIGCMKDNFITKSIIGFVMPVAWGGATGIIGSSLLGGSDISKPQSATQTASSKSSSETCSSGVAGEIYVEAVEEKFTNPDITVLRTG